MFPNAFEERPDRDDEEESEDDYDDYVDQVHDDYDDDDCVIPQRHSSLPTPQKTFTREDRVQGAVDLGRAEAWTLARFPL